MSLVVSSGTLVAEDSGGVTVTNSGSGSLTLTATATDLLTFISAQTNIQYTGAPSAVADNAATLNISFTVPNTIIAGTLNYITYDLTPINIDINNGPELAGLNSVTFTENAVNAAPL
ncbi:MAG: hypothetical protein P8P70_00010 [Sulfitobacter sp.]|nr:hypothetical protein [Sulfitobacter sp.]